MPIPIPFLSQSSLSRLRASALCEHMTACRRRSLTQLTTRSCASARYQHPEVCVTVGGHVFFVGLVTNSSAAAAARSTRKGYNAVRSFIILLPNEHVGFPSLAVFINVLVESSFQAGPPQLMLRCCLRKHFVL